MRSSIATRRARTAAVATGQSLKRRELVTLLAGAAAWPLVGHAQQAERVPRVGVLMGFPEDHPLTHAFVTAFAQALGRFGWVEGKNIRLEQPLCRRRSRLLQDLCGRTGRPGARSSSRKSRAGGRRAAGADAYNTDRFCACAQSCRAWFCSDPGATPRQHHGVQLL